MFPGLVATGGCSAAWRKSAGMLVSSGMHPTTILDETDMAVILEKCLENDVNLAVGPSVGRYLEEMADIPVERIGFPIQDRLGAQRILSVGYTGSALLLDRMVNKVLEKKHKAYRSDSYDRYYGKKEASCNGIS